MDISGIEGGICADFDHLVQFGVIPVYTEDLAIFLMWYGQMDIPPCSGPGSGNDEDPLPNSEFNFWMNAECGYVGI